MKLETVVVGLDLTAPSLFAARWVAEHFAPDARLILVHCPESRWLPRFLVDTKYEGLRNSVQVQARTALEEFAEELGSERVRTVVAERRTAEALVEEAAEHAADLLVVGAHRRRPIVGSVIGSSASHLLADSKTPVLVAHGLPPAAPRHVMAAIDESSVGKQVLAWATSMAERFDVPGHVLFAIEPPGVDVRTTLFSSAKEYRDERARIIRKAEMWLEGVVGDADVDRERFRTSVEYGRPELEIVSAADRLGSELIVMGTRGLGRAHALAVGSVARGVLETSGCPVLIIPPEGA